MGRNLLGIVALAMLASGLVPQVARAEEPTVVGRTAGRIECHTYLYERPDGSKGTTERMPCDRRWDIDVPNGTEWSFDETRQFEGRAGNGISYTSTIRTTATYTMTLDEQGRLTKLDLTADLESTVKHAGDTSLQLKLDLPFTAGAEQLRLTDTLTALARGTDAYVSRVEMSAELECTGDGSEPTSGGNRVLEQRGRDVRTIHQGSPTANLDLSTGDGSCVLHVLAKVNAENPVMVKADHTARARAQLEIHLEEAPCDLSGTVFDGDAAIDGHANPLSGIRVELYEDGDATGNRDATDSEGRFCLRDVARGEYYLLADLTDAAHEPSLFRTVYGTSNFSGTSRLDVAEEDWGRDDLKVDFRATDEQPWRADAANIHWQATRFVDWLLEAGITTEAEFGHVFMVTGDSGGTRYASNIREAYIAPDDTPYAKRAGPLTECPENCEWHELGHHVAHQLGIAASGPACDGDVNHGGWVNRSTCDSMQEGFASFLSTLGSLTIDADRGAGYATPDYFNFGNMEAGIYLPWSVYASGSGRIIGREEFAVTELLWDLADDTPAESLQVALVSTRPIGFNDTIALSGPTIVRLMAAADVNTVAGLLAALQGSDAIPEALWAATYDLDQDGTDDIGPMAAVFLSHDFHPVHEVTDPWYHPGDPTSVTDRQPIDPTTGRPPSPAPAGTLESRHHIDAEPGFAIAFTNDTSAPIAYAIDIDYPGDTTSHFTVDVDPGERQVVELQLAPYWRTAGWTGSLPACDPANDLALTLTISGGGTEPRTISNCEYWKLATGTSSDSALSFPALAAVPSTGPGTTPGTSPGGEATQSGPGPNASVLGIVAAVVALAVVALLVLAVRRRRASGPG